MPRLSKIGAAALAAFGWTGLQSVDASYLVVAGGGGGGSGESSRAGGGGGAGGLLSGTTSLNPTLSYTVTVGAGGVGGVDVTSNSNTSGSNSVFNAITSTGGGAGGTTGTLAGQNGGSGGGGSNGSAAGTGVSGQGSAGGVGQSAGNSYGGGGGGASAAGTNGSSGVGGTGGAGTANSITGSSVTYAGGGGGGLEGTGTQGAGGAGGGGTGNNGTGTNAASGTANLGGGGGGAGKGTGGAAVNGGNGGSGVVIISYPGAQQFGGGNVTTDGTNTIHTFTTSGTLVPATPLTAQYLIVAGGGGAGFSRGAGGGAGGLLTSTGLTIDTNSNYVVTVGAGGAGNTSSGAGTSGTSSSFSTVTTTAVGGGGGGGAASSTGLSGGSGGGAAQGGSAGTATSGQGNAGGTQTGGNEGAGGGGGAGAVGSNTTTQAGGNGGVGIASSITGTSTYYAGGGGGGSNSNAATGTGGLGGGGNGGASSDAAGSAGTANTGGGGGGGRNNTVGTSGGAGGSGVVIIAYPGSTQQMAGGTVTISGGNVIHTFTSSGYLTPIKYASRSLRFRASNSAYLNRTFGSTGNTKTWTWSGWVKRGTLGTKQNIFGQVDLSVANRQCYVSFETDNTLSFRNYTVSGYDYQLFTTQVFRDPSAWYHLVIVSDTTQATSTNRLKIYVNGAQVTAFGTATYPSQNFDGWINANAGSGVQLGIGRAVPYNTTEYVDGYFAEVNFIDGAALTPSSFGTFNSFGVWQPITYGGSYGTNGFYLPFSAQTSISASYLVVAGGGGGGKFGGGGGAGGFRTSSTSISSALSYTVTVGAGGAGATGRGANGISGSDSVFSSITSTGGGGGNSGNVTGANSGGSGGGLGNNNSVVGTGGAGNTPSTSPSQGNNGGANSSDFQQCGGGGGASAVGGDGNTTGSVGGNGGAGTASSISGTSVTYAGGGGGAANVTAGTGGAGGGGAGAIAVSNGTAGTANTGGGGGGSRDAAGGGGNGAAGGSGVVIVSYAGAAQFTGGTITSSGGNTIHTFTSSGTLVGNIAADYSPQGNNWTTNNISLTAGATYDSMLDVPTLTSSTVNNYCVLNPLITDYTGGSGPVVVQNGNLQLYRAAATGWGMCGSTFGVSSGKWYWEAINTGSNCVLGIHKTQPTTYFSIVGYNEPNGYGYGNDGNKLNNNTGTAYGATYANGDVIGVALDMDAGTLTFYKNNTSQGTAFSGLSGTFAPAFSCAGLSYWDANFGQQGFTYTPPSGFVALNTYNLSTPTIPNGAVYMAATTYTGTGATQVVTNTVNGTAMQPDFVWLKSRSAARDHRLMDTNRGINYILYSDLTIAEATGSALSSVNSNGFTLNTTDNQNVSSETYIGWQWKANAGTNVSNTSGSITSTVSANTTAGFAVVTYTGTGANATVGHGLGVAPSMIIVKNRTTGSTSWNVYHISTGNTGAMFLDTTNAFSADSTRWNNTTPTSTVFSIGSGSGVNQNTNALVAYVFAAVAGYSAMGSYTGNGSTDGPFVYTGFRPRFVLIKCSSNSTGSTVWTIWDTSRSPYNASVNELYPNLNAVEGVDSSGIDILSNGFKPKRNSEYANLSGWTYIYMAFAENPFKYSNAR